MVWGEGLVPWVIFLLSAAMIVYAGTNCPVMAMRWRNSPVWVGCGSASL
jgi:hypothetical protein